MGMHAPLPVCGMHAWMDAWHCSHALCGSRCLKPLHGHTQSKPGQARSKITNGFIHTDHVHGPRSPRCKKEAATLTIRPYHAKARHRLHDF